MSKKKSASKGPTSDAPENAASDEEAAAGTDEIEAGTGDSKQPMPGEADADPGDAEAQGTQDPDAETTATPLPEDDPEQARESGDKEVAESPAEVSAEADAGSVARTEADSKSEAKPEARPSSESVSPKRGFPWFGLFNFLLIAALAGAAYYYWREQQALDAAYQAQIEELQRQVDASGQAVSSRLQSSLQSSIAPLESDIAALQGRIDELGLGQKDLRETSIKLFELYGRDKNDWQLAEVEYLMRVAQHRLILQDDFAGAAITLQAASDRIGLTGDPGLLPVRLMISEEIADLKTRRRADLVGMTLKLAQLGRQVRSLQPGFALRIGDDGDAEAPPATPASPDDWMGQFTDFLDSLITVRKQSSDPTVIEANIVDVAATLEDTLKLARWAVLERDARQYQLLIDRSLELFREFYDLDNAANQDFIQELEELQKQVIRPEKPDITGSLRELQRILSQRENAPPEAPATESQAGETVDG